MHVALVNQGDWTWLPRNCLWNFHTKHSALLLFVTKGGQRDLDFMLVELKNILKTHDFLIFLHCTYVYMLMLVRKTGLVLVNYLFTLSKSLQTCIILFPSWSTKGHARHGVSFFILSMETV